MLYVKAEAEGTRLRNPYDTIVEGIGLNRLTANFVQAQIDSAVRGSDQEAVSMVCWNTAYTTVYSFVMASVHRGGVQRTCAWSIRWHGVL